MNVEWERRIKMISAFAYVLWPDTHKVGDERRLGIPYDESEDQVWLKLQVNGCERWIHEAEAKMSLGSPGNSEPKKSHMAFAPLTFFCRAIYPI